MLYVMLNNDTGCGFLFVISSIWIGCWYWSTGRTFEMILAAPSDELEIFCYFETTDYRVTFSLMTRIFGFHHNDFSVIWITFGGDNRNVAMRWVKYARLRFFRRPDACHVMTIYNMCILVRPRWVTWLNYWRRRQRGRQDKSCVAGMRGVDSRERRVEA